MAAARLAVRSSTSWPEVQREAPVTVRKSRLLGFVPKVQKNPHPDSSSG